MKIRLIEPISPSRHLWSKSYFVRLGLPIIAATLKEAGHDVLIYNPQLAPIDWDDVYSSDLVGLSSTTSTIVDRLRASPTTCAAAASPSSSAARTSPSWPTRRWSTPTTWPAARAARQLMLELIGGAGRRPRARHHRRPLVHGATASPCTTPLHERCADLDTLPFPDLTPAGRQRADHEHADHDQLGLPVRLHLLLGDGDVRQEVPLPQRRERRRRDQGEAARSASSSTTTTWPPTGSGSRGCCS